MRALIPGTYRFTGNFAKPWDMFDLNAGGYVTFHDSADGYTTMWTEKATSAWVEKMLSWIGMGLLVMEGASP